mgnify:FL=1
MKFQRSKIENLLKPGSTIWLHKKERDETDQKDGFDFEIRASSMSVEMFGPLTFRNDDDLQDFARALSNAWTDHLKLSRELKKSLVV